MPVVFLFKILFLSELTKVKTNMMFMLARLL